MILCFECPQETKLQIDAMMASGGYRDYGDLISCAVANLSVMEKEVAASGGAVIVQAACRGGMPSDPIEGKSQDSGKRSIEGDTPRPARKSPDSRPSPMPPKTRSDASPVAGVPAIFQLKELPKKTSKRPADLPPDMWDTNSAIPLDRWILGQYNRLLPAKANVRGLLWMYEKQGTQLDVARASSFLADEAIHLGDHLAALDRQQCTPRDEQLSTAFPTTGEGAEKAKLRYANQFVVYKNSKGELSGLMPALKFVSTTHGASRLVPTTAACEFARLPNPVLDGASANTVDKFSAEERNFLIEHIANSVPVEAFAFKAILGALCNGCNSPDKLDAALCANMPDDRALELSKSYLASQRSGAISRMADLGLVYRERQGVRVFYHATDAGLHFLDGIRGECEAAHE